MLVSLISCKKTEKEDKIVVMETTNTLLKDWEGPFGGVPAFDQMKVSDVKEALEIGMDLHLAEIETIANQTAEATFDNTIEAMERAGKKIDDVFVYYGIFSSNMSSPEFREIQKEMSPVLSEYRSKIAQNEKLFARIKAVYNKSQNEALAPDQQRVVDLIYKNFEMNGANPDPKRCR